MLDQVHVSLVVPAANYDKFRLLSIDVLGSGQLQVHNGG